MDYRELLKKYIDHVSECEGVSFLRDLDKSELIFTDEEWDELQALDNEALTQQPTKQQPKD